MSEIVSAASEASSVGRIMVVDDELLIRESVVDIMAACDVEVVAAADGSECLRLLREGFRGLIFMDVQMPGMNGWQTIREIENFGMIDGNVFIMLTGLDQPDEQMDGLQQYVVDYMRKPFAINELIMATQTYGNYLQG